MRSPGMDVVGAESLEDNARSEDVGSAPILK